MSGPRIRGVAPKEQRTYNGKVYMSASEARHAAELDIQKRCGLVSDWRSQVPFQITVNGKNICRVVIDFGVDMPNGTTHYEEVKGFETEIYHLKKKLLLACYPGIDYRVVKVKRKR